MIETLQGRIDMAVEDLKDRIEYAGGAEDFFSGDWHDVVSEIADSTVPVYYWDIKEVASSALTLMLDVPEMGPAFDGTPTPINIIAANIYERLTGALYEKAAELGWH